MFFLRSRNCTHISLRISYLTAIILLLFTGAMYRGIASYLNVIVQRPVELPVSLSEFPMVTPFWEGVDVALSENVKRIAGNDDFINRFYSNEIDKMWCNVYITYSARPRYMSGHKPEICYVAAGWIHDSTDESELFTVNGRSINYLVHRFHKPTSQKTEIVVLNFYILNGIVTVDDSSFTGLSWRSPNISGDPARYVSQIQVSSEFEKSAQYWLEQMADKIFEFFPDPSGIVKAEETIEAIQN